MPQERCPEYRRHTDLNYRCHRNECPVCGPLKAKDYYETFKDVVGEGRWLGLTLTLSSKLVPKDMSFSLVKPMFQALVKRSKRVREESQYTPFIDYLGVVDVQKSGWAHIHVLVRVSETCNLSEFKSDVNNFVNNWTKTQIDLKTDKQIASAHIQDIKSTEKRWLYHAIRKLRPWTQFPVWPYPINYKPFLISRALRPGTSVDDQLSL